MTYDNGSPVDTGPYTATIIRSPDWLVCDVKRSPKSVMKAFQLLDKANDRGKDLAAKAETARAEVRELDARTRTAMARGQEPPTADDRAKLVTDAEMFEGAAREAGREAKRLAEAAAAAMGEHAGSLQKLAAEVALEQHAIACQTIKAHAAAFDAREDALTYSGVGQLRRPQPGDNVHYMTISGIPQRLTLARQDVRDATIKFWPKNVVRRVAEKES